MVRTSGCALLAMLVLQGCGSSTPPLIQSLSPLSGSTLQDPALAPVLRASDGVRVEAGERRVVLYDVTAGARQTVPGDVEILGAQFTYRPGQPLAAGHDFELTVDRGALVGEAVDELDASESPEEPLAWPLRWRFSTSPRPQVRAAYFDRSRGSGRLTVRFSQPMDPAATGPEIQVQDLQGQALAIAAVAWPDGATALVDLSQVLDPAQPYRLQVSARALGANGLRLDGDGDATGGEPEDAFAAAFTGSQPIILSRFRPAR